MIAFGKHGMLFAYLQSTMPEDDKISKIKQDFPELSGIYEQDLKILLAGWEYLPIVRGVEITTKFDPHMRSYVAITEMPEMPDSQEQSEIQKAFMRVCGRVDQFSYEKWGIGEPTAAAAEYLGMYFAEQKRKWIRGEEAGYPRVLEAAYEIVENAPNGCYEIVELMGVCLD